MPNELIVPDKFFLNRFGMNHGALERILGSALERKADYADLYFEYRSAEGLGLEESMVNHTSKSISQGVGVRVCAEDRTGYAYTDEVTVDRMRLAAEAARAIADQRGTVPAAVQVGAPMAHRALYDLESTPLDVPVFRKAKYNADPPSSYVLYGVQALQVILKAIAGSDGTRKSVTAQVLGGAGIDIPAGDAILGKEIKIDPATGDVNTIDISILQMKDNKEGFLQTFPVS
jgi:hypothetical protein